MYADINTLKNIIELIQRDVIGINIKNILLNDEIKNYVLSENSNILTYLYMILTKTNNTYINLYLESSRSLFEPVFNTLQINQMCSNEKYTTIMANYRTTINDENMYDNFLELFGILICDITIAIYNHLYNYFFDNRDRIKSIKSFNEVIKKINKNINKLHRRANNNNINTNSIFRQEPDQKQEPFQEHEDFYDLSSQDINDSDNEDLMSINSDHDDVIIQEQQEQEQEQRTINVFTQNVNNINELSQ